MATTEKIDRALAKGIISIQTARALKKYNDLLGQKNLPIIYNLRHLRKILNIQWKEQDKFFGKKRNEYHIFTIPKKNGTMRIIEAPSDRLKKYQIWIKENILDRMVVSDSAKGFKRNCSILDNAKEHINKELVINIDLKDFFPSITYDMVYEIFVNAGYTTGVSHLLTRLCTNKKNVLPQGSPASPIISNIVCSKLDKRLFSLAKKYKCSYTRYADDITFSGNAGIKNMLPTVKKIIAEERFVINDSKVRLQYRNMRQVVTGLIVNKRITVSPQLSKEIERAIYYSLKYGVEDHMKRIGCNKSFYKEHLYGIAYFIKMVDNHKGENYLARLDKINWPY